ncbi:MAG: chorismate synthase [Clostridia bacterium]|nr:chorismate synthase [Clostridia bacterium]
MKNSFGNAINITLFGESHGAGVGVLIDGIAPGIKIHEDFIAHQLTLRRPSGKISTARREPDEYVIQSGVYNGYTTGAPLCIFIPNTDTRSRDYTPELPRPSHADLTAHEKYHGFEDYRGGGHFSGRLTAALVAAGAIVIPALREKGIYIGTCINRIDRIGLSDIPTDRDGLLAIADSDYGLTDDYAIAMMKDTIELAANEGDSVGGVLETAIIGLPAGLGEPWFDGVESQIASTVFGIPAVKSVAFGAKDIETMRGSRANDAFIVKDGKIVTATNNSGGIQGGITNGMPVIFRTAIKPTPSISQNQLTVNMQTLEETVLNVKGRHDPCIVPRARIVIDSVAALVVADMLTVRYGSDALTAK